MVLLSLAIMVMDQRGQLHFVRSSLSTLVYPLQVAAAMPVEFAKWASDSLSSRTELIRENTRLKEELLLSKSKLSRFDALSEENRHLRELMDSYRRPQDRVLVAELMAVDMQPQRQQITINKGKKEGVYVGQPVIDALGVMGQVVQVGAFSSSVLLITDLRHALPVQVNRNGLRTVAVGTGNTEYLQLAHLPVNADIRIGDLLVSSGLGQRFPRGYPVGIVSTLVRDEGASFLNATVKPSARPDKSREVLMIWPAEHVAANAGQ